jgi:hypothetical protein
LDGGLNSYLYANANPSRFVDPFGLYGSIWDMFPTPAWPEIDRDIKRIKAVAKEAGQCILCTAECSLPIGIQSIAEDIAIRATERKAEELAEEAARQGRAFPKKWVKRVIQVAKHWGGVGTIIAVADCAIECVDK